MIVQYAAACEATGPASLFHPSSPHNHVLLRTSHPHRVADNRRSRTHGPLGLCGGRRAGVLDGLRPDQRRQLLRLLPPTDRMGAEADCQLRHSPLLLGRRQRQRGREHGLRQGSDCPAARVPGQARGAGRGRDRSAQMHEERSRHAVGADRIGAGAGRADALPHAAFGGQIQGDADDSRYAARRRPRRSQPRVHRSLRGTYDPDGARRRLLGGHHALPAHQGHARTRRGYGGNVRRGTHPGQFLGRLGAFRSAGRDGFHSRSAPPRTCRFVHPADRV